VDWLCVDCRGKLDKFEGRCPKCDGPEKEGKMKICKECKWLLGSPLGSHSNEWSGIWLCGSPTEHPRRDAQTGEMYCDYKNKTGDCSDWEAKPPKRSFWQWLTVRGVTRD